MEQSLSRKDFIEVTGALSAFIREHGARVRRAEAMALLDIGDPRTFEKVVDANPDLRHRLPGEKQDKYVTAVIFYLRPQVSKWVASPATPLTRCATRGEIKI